MVFVGVFYYGVVRRVGGFCVCVELFFVFFVFSFFFFFIFFLFGVFGCIFFLGSLVYFSLERGEGEKVFIFFCVFFFFVLFWGRCGVMDVFLFLLVCVFVCVFFIFILRRGFCFKVVLDYV